MSKIENPAVARVFDRYPEPRRKKLIRLRQLVLDAASETEGVETLEETLKWGEPSYLTKGVAHSESTGRTGRRTSTRCTSIATLRWLTHSENSTVMCLCSRATEP